MIDTDKYEGHTEGLWFDGEPTEISNTISNAFFQLYPNKLGKANARLAIDAPLLLAEVKRLRGLLNMIVDKALHEVNTQPNGDDSPYNNILNIAYEGVIE